VVHDGKPQLFGRLHLELLYLLVGKFRNFGALYANDVVVVAVFREVLVPCLPVPELTGDGKAALGQKLHRSVDGGVADVRRFSFDFFEELVEAYVGVGLEEGIGDVVPLGR